MHKKWLVQPGHFPKSSRSLFQHKSFFSTFCTDGKIDSDAFFIPPQHTRSTAPEELSAGMIEPLKGFERAPNTAYGHMKIGMVVFPEFIREKIRRAMKSNPYKRLFIKDVARINAIAQAAHAVLPAAPDPKDPRIRTPFSGRKAEGSLSFLLFLVDFSQLALEYSERDALAYAVAQAPYTYGPIKRVFYELAQRFPQWTPSTVLDFGCGPGTALWAAKETWGDRLGQCVGMDLSEGMITFADRITSSLQNEYSINATYRRFLHFNNDVEKAPTYEMIVASFVLNELDSIKSKETDHPILELTLNSLWKSTASFLVLIERGTPFGSKLIIQAREYILSQGDGKIVAPCPHSGSCPMMGSWCHFSQRVQLPREMMETMQYKKNTTDCSFSFVIIQKTQMASASMLQEKVPNSWPRIIASPNKLKNKVVLDLCTPEGIFICYSKGTLQRHQIPRSLGRQQYYDARKSYLGELWPYHPPTIKPHIHYDFGRRGRNRTDPYRLQPVSSTDSRDDIQTS